MRVFFSGGECGYLNVSTKKKRSVELIKLWRSPPPPFLPKKKMYSAVIVEVRCHAALAVAVASALRVLPPSAPVVLWHAPRNGAFVANVTRRDAALDAARRSGRLRARLLPRPPTDAELRAFVYHPSYWYQRLLTSASFWRLMETEWVIRFQSDVLFCARPPRALVTAHPFLGGASGFVRRTAAPLRMPADPRAGALTESHLNGGLSVHHVPWTLRCIRRSRRAYVEDDLFNACRGNVSELDAYLFASDNGVTACFTFASQRHCPFGVHKPWARASRAALAELRAHCPGLGALRRRQHEVACD